MKKMVVGLVACLSLGSATANAQAVKADGGFAAQSLTSCETDLRYLNQVMGWQVYWPRSWQSIVSSKSTDLSDKVNEWSGAPAAIDSAIEKLRHGIANKQTAPQAVVTRIVQQVELLAPAITEDNSKYAFNDQGDESKKAWNKLMEKDIAPAIVRFQQFLKNEYLPATSTVAGLSKLPDGKDCFVNAVKWWTTLELSTEEIEAIGNKYLTDSRNQLLETGKEGDSVASMLADLRRSPKENKTSESELIRVSELALERAQEKTLLAFSHKTDKEIAVKAMPKYMQASAPAGYYGVASGDNPARYIINPSRPSERRLMAEVIAFHEGVPGHHFWSTYPRKNPSTGYNSGILEGWAIYSEYLADEMNLYSTTYDRQGMIAKHLWAASRLIVEPGLHLRGWSREQAINFMLENTVMSQTEIEIEVDRYLAMPGQSLSYILGADLILSERARAKESLGDAFELTAFHDVILESGVRSLPQVRDDIRSWTRQVATQ